MKKIYLLLAAALLCGAWSCSKEEAATDNVGYRTVSFRVELPTATRAGLNATTDKMSWAARDTISMGIGDYGGMSFYIDENSLSPDGRWGTITGTVPSSIVDGTKYPIMAAHAFGTSAVATASLTTPLMSTQLSPQNYYEDGIVHLALYAYVKSEELSKAVLQFKCPFTVLHLSLTADVGTTVSSIAFEDYNIALLNGYFGNYTSVIDPATGYPHHRSDETLNERSIVLNCHNTALSAQAKDFYIMVPPVNYPNGYIIKVHTNKGIQLLTKRSSADYSAKANVIVSLPAAHITGVMPQSEIPDANFRAGLVRLGFIRENGDQTISLLDDGSVNHYMSLSYSNIADVTGVWYFTYLYRFECSGCPMTSVSLTRHPSLTEVDLSFTNTLTTLDISGCQTTMTSLDCSGNKLTTLDLSHQTRIATLRCSNNRLSSLDVSGLTYTTLLCGSQTSDGTTPQQMTLYMSSTQTLDETNNPNVTVVRK